MMAVKMFSPAFTITPKMTQALMDIEASRQAVSHLPVSPQLIHSLRESARLHSTHYSTQIEGNRLTKEEVAVVAKGGAFPNRKRDETEVRNYFMGLDYVDELVGKMPGVLDVEMIQTIHGCVMNGKKKPSKYRDGQNAIYESGSGAIIYMPPEWSDVSLLMQEMVEWINSQKGELPIPVIAGIAHYQFATIHPYFDGNGRTARLLTNLVLHWAGYGLEGIYSLEEYYASDLASYYEAISVGESHNYYMGRAEADITGWVEYFCQGMADSFAKVRVQAEKLRDSSDQKPLLRELGSRQKRVLALFRESRFVTTKKIANYLQVHPRTALNWCHQWVDSGFLISSGEKKNRKYELAEKWLPLLSDSE